MRLRDVVAVILLPFNSLNSEKEVSVYVHWPFCESKCPYCDFNSHVRDSVDHELFLQSYLKELDFYAEYLFDKKITSVFFGGGTPSLAPPKLFSSILEKIHCLAELASDAEITMEANPSSVDIKNFKEFANSGINRISIGVQSFNDQALKFLGRKHDADLALQAIDIAATVFTNYSFDLIYALPWHDVENWSHELTRALKYAGNHISLYQLTIEKGTSFFRDYKLNKFTLPQDDIAADLYLVTNELLRKHFLNPYEISNYAKPGYECRHNLSYWRYQNYIGIGPGAHGRITERGKKIATMNYHSPEKWLSLLKSDVLPNQQKEALSTLEERNERIMMGLRLFDGIEIDFFDKDQELTCRIEQMCQLSLLIFDQGRIKVTQAGSLVLNSVTNFLLK